MNQIYRRLKKFREKYINTLAKLYDYATTVYSKKTYTQWYDTKDGSYTYATFKSECDALSKVLTQYGIGAGDKVAILSTNMPNWSVAFFSTVAFGRISIPILPDSSENEVTNIINHSESKVLFVAKKMVAGLEKGKKSVNPSFLFTLSGVLFAVMPPIKATYLALEKGKLKRFAEKIGKKL